MATKVLVVKLQFNPARAFMTSRALYTIVSERSENEVGVQRDTRAFRGSVQRGHCVSDSHLRVEPGVVGIPSEQGQAGFLESNGCCFPSAQLTKVGLSFSPLSQPPLCWDQRLAS